jgi:hypothetical protein
VSRRSANASFPVGLETNPSPGSPAEPEIAHRINISHFA